MGYRRRFFQQFKSTSNLITHDLIIQIVIKSRQLFNVGISIMMHQSINAGDVAVAINRIIAFLSRGTGSHAGISIRTGVRTHPEKRQID